MGWTVLIDEDYESYPVTGHWEDEERPDYYRCGVIEWDLPDYVAHGKVNSCEQLVGGGSAQGYVEYQAEGRQAVVPMGVARADFKVEILPGEGLSGGAGMAFVSLWAKIPADADDWDGTGVDQYLFIQFEDNTLPERLRFSNGAAGESEWDPWETYTTQVLEPDVWYTAQIQWDVAGVVVFTLHEGEVELERWETAILPSRKIINRARMGSTFYMPPGGGPGWRSVTDNAYYATYSPMSGGTIPGRRHFYRI